MNTKRLILVTGVLLILATGSAMAATIDFSAIGTSRFSPDLSRWNSTHTSKSPSIGESTRIVDLDGRPGNDTPGDDNTENVVPEPTTLTLFGLGALGLGLYRRMRRS